MLDRPSAGDVFHALADPTRRYLLETLGRGARSVSELAAPLDISLAAVAQHVRVLERSGLVQTEKIGRVRTCRLDTRGLQEIERWISQRRAAWSRDLDKLGEHLLAEETVRKGRTR